MLRYVLPPVIAGQIARAVQPESLLRYLLPGPEVLPGSPLLPGAEVLQDLVLPSSEVLPGTDLLRPEVLPGSEMLPNLVLQRLLQAQAV